MQSKKNNETIDLKRIKEYPFNLRLKKPIANTVYNPLLGQSLSGKSLLNYKKSVFMSGNKFLNDTLTEEEAFG